MEPNGSDDDDDDLINEDGDDGTGSSCWHLCRCCCNDASSEGDISDISLHTFHKG